MEQKGSQGADSIIAAVRAWLSECELLSEIPSKKRFIDWTAADSENYGIFPDGDILLKKFINGGGKRQYNFTLYINRITAEDDMRLRNAAFLERLQNWCEDKTITHELPELPTGMSCTKIEAANGMLAEIPPGKKYGKYLIQFKLFYMKGR